MGSFRERLYRGTGNGNCTIYHRQQCNGAAGAKKYGISKSTVHKDITERLRQISPALAVKTRVVLDVNKSERHIRGGMATREKYLHQHEVK